ncbi:hypothetical protein ABIB57_004545 [Devosia sp. UYZn731]|uniref:hypothetical protein n=1 Tax=Devosia sp. UYZn731 TaxID=3156345 RepID=UPI0033949178
MPASFRRHDSTAQNISPADRQAYARLKAELLAANIGQAEVDTKLNSFFWQCFEDDDEDEGEPEGE